MSETAPDDVVQAVKNALGTYDLKVEGEMETTVLDDGQYKVEVPFSGKLRLENVLSNQGRLLYNKEAEIMWEAVDDGNLVLAVRMND